MTGKLQGSDCIILVLEKKQDYQTELSDSKEKKLLMPPSQQNEQFKVQMC